MNRSEIAALAEGMVPFVRECVSEATAPLTARIAELEARPAEKGAAGEQGPQGEAGPSGPPGPMGETNIMLPPEVAEQVASAVRLLHESPLLEGRAAPQPSSPKVARIERDEQGNFVPVYE